MATRALNYTTTITVERTVAEVQALLGRHGASETSVIFEDGAAVGMGFTLRTPHGERHFRLPVNIAAMQRLLLSEEAAGAFKGARRAAGHFTSDEHAARVAWRVVKDWVEAQMALVAAEMARVDEVFLPYLVVEGRSGTLYARYRQHEDALALQAGSSDA